jgi:GH24 family phage-related lysozyme (muramidase)
MGAMMSQMMMQAMMQMMLGLLSQCFSQCSGGAFSPQMSPAFGGCGPMGGSGNFGGGAGMCQPFNPCQNFLGGGGGGHYGGDRHIGGQDGGNSNSSVPHVGGFQGGTSPTSGAYGVQTIGGRSSMKEGVIELKDPETGEVLGSYQFRNGGHGRGSIPYGDYEVSRGRRRSDKSSMQVGGYGYSFDLTQKGKQEGCADDSRFAAQRELLRIHPDGGSAGTEGCMGIVGDASVQRDFYTKAKALQDKYGGKFSLSFQESQGNGGAQGQEAAVPGAAQGAERAGGGDSSVPISARSKELIKKSEGFDQPGKWPGASSGITLGVGYDLGYVTKEEFRRDWKDKLPPDQMARLERAIGVKGKDAKAIASQFSDIKVPQGAANQVFDSATLPKFYAQAKKAFPGMEKLPPDAQGALTSLVFNRGASMKGDRREEMRNIRSLVSRYQPGNPTPALNGIAGEIRDMKRLWVGQGLNGLLTRRDNEASLVQSAGYGGGMMLASR